MSFYNLSLIQPNYGNINILTLNIVCVFMCLSLMQNIHISVVIMALEEVIGRMWITTLKEMEGQQLS